jgi:hypothetical protein
MAKLTWLIEVLGMDKLSTLEQKLRDLDKASSSRTIGATAPAAAAQARGAGSVVIGGVPLNANQLDAIERAAKQLGTTMQGLAQNNPRLLQGILGGLTGGGLTPVKATLDEIKSAFAAAPPIIAGATAGAAGSTLSRAVASLFQRIAGTGAANIPGMSGLGGMWTMRPIAQIASALGGVGLVAASAALAGLAAAAGAVTIAFHALSRAIESGARLFDRAARTGVGAGRLSQLEQLARVAGIDPSQIERMMSQGQFGRNELPISFQGLMLGARRTRDFALMQQLANNQPFIEFQQRQSSFVTGRAAIDRFASTAKEIDVISKSIDASWQTIEAHLANAVLPQIKGLLDVTQKITNSMATAINTQPGWLKAFERGFLPYFFGGPAALGLSEYFRSRGLSAAPQAGDISKQFMGLPYVPTANRFERMGFVTSPFSGADQSAKETARNTKELVDLAKEQKRRPWDPDPQSLWKWSANPNANIP